MNWIKCSEILPASANIEVLALCKNEIYIGNFSATESYGLNPDGSQKDYKKTIFFEPTIWLQNNHCDEYDKPGSKCGDNDKCIDCCEKDYEIALLGLRFNFNEVSHWMLLPPSPPPKDIE